MKKEKRWQLFSANEIRALHRRACDILESIANEEEEDEDDDDDDAIARATRADPAWEAAVDALRFCCSAARLLGDPSLLPLVAEAIEESEHWNDDMKDRLSTMVEAVEALIQAGAGAEETIEELARNEHASVRQAVAEGLRPESPFAIRILEALALDGTSGVRTAAKERLSTVQEVAWWKGKWRRDPLAVLSEEEALRHKESLGKISELLDKPMYSLAKSEAELVNLAKALPDELLVDLAETLHATPDEYGTLLYRLLAEMLKRRGGPEAFARLCFVWGENTRVWILKDTILKMLIELPAKARRNVCRALMGAAAALPDEKRRVYGISSASFIAELAGSAWPPGEDVTPVLETILALPVATEDKHPHDAVADGLAFAFKREDANTEKLWQRGFEARLAGYPGAWAFISSEVDEWLRRAPVEVLRPAAEQAALSADASMQRWGIETLLKNAFDPERDGSRFELAQRLLREPSYRGELFSHGLIDFVLPAARDELRRGALNFDEASTVIRSLGSFYGGVADGVIRKSHRHTPEAREAGLAKAREEHEAWLGPAELRGPPTDEEWRILRALRAEWLDNGGVPDDLGCLGPTPWGECHPDDQATVERARCMLRETGNADIAMAIASFLSMKPDARDLPLWDEIVARAPKNGRPLLKLWRRDVREAVGAPEGKGGAASAAKGAGGAQGPAGEWMDEPDDD